MEKRKAGRPAGSRNRERKDGVRVNLYLDRQASEALWALARSRGESRNQTVEHLIAAVVEATVDDPVPVSGTRGARRRERLLTGYATLKEAGGEAVRES